LGLVRYCCLFHTLLTHNPPLGSAVLLRNLMKAGRIFSCRLSNNFPANHGIVGEHPSLAKIPSLAEILDSK
jgi:hypothetical protein